MSELIYLCDTDDKEELQATLNKYWGIDSVRELSRDDSFRLAICIARVSDYLSYTGKTLDQLNKWIYPT